MLRFELRHAGEVAQEVGALDVRRLEAGFFQLAQEAAVAGVDGTADTTKVAIVVVRRAAVDMVDGHARRNGFAAPGRVDGTRYIYHFMMPEGIPKVVSRLIVMVECAIFMLARKSGIDLMFGTVRKDLDADDAALTAADVERDACLRMYVLPVPRHMPDTNGIVKKRF